MLADEVDYVIGVDTHRDGTRSRSWSRRRVRWWRRLVRAGTGYGGRSVRRSARRGVRVWAIEGAGHYGAGLTRFLGDGGETVLEVGRSARGERRLRGRTIRSTRSAQPARGSPAER